MGDQVLLQEMGKRIFQRRKALHMTQEQVAEKMNVSVQMISNLELGNKAIRPENLKNCATRWTSVPIICYPARQMTPLMPDFPTKSTSCRKINSLWWNKW